MLDEGASPNGALVPVTTFDPGWQPIFHVSNQVVLYHPTSHALAIRQSPHFPKVRPLSTQCPYCNRPLPSDFDPDVDESNHMHGDSSPELHSRASNYFQLLAIANEVSSRPSTPPPESEERRERKTMFAADAMAEGYFKAFFQEECRLGMGANGTVFLCQHMLDGNPLGHFAVKKIAVGESHQYLFKVLREVRLLERLHHPNIITYHHAWLETCQFSPFGPKIPTLHLLMQWAEGGSLDDFIDSRLGRSTQIHKKSNDAPHLSDLSSSDSPAPFNNANLHSRSARIRAFRAFQHAPADERERLRDEMECATDRLAGHPRTTWTAVHLLSADEVKTIFRDVTEGLTFLHDRSILHLDLKPGNVLLTWDEGKLIPRAMLSDFGTSRDMLHSTRPRSGNTGTLEYTAPESLPSPQTGLVQQVNSNADMWSLGMILHKLLFFKLPYHHASDADPDGRNTSASDRLDQLEKEVLSYNGFQSSQALVTAFEARRLPHAFLFLLESLLDVIPSRRPSCERVSSAIREGRLDPLPADFHATFSSLIPLVHRPNNGDSHMSSTKSTRDARLSNNEGGIRDGHGGQVGGPARGGEQLDSSKEETTRAETDEITPLLGLPAPIGNSNVWARLIGSIKDMMGTRTETQKAHWRSFWTDMLKSVMLATRVLTLAYLCPNAYPGPVVVMSFILVIIVDRWFDRLWISAVLCVPHIVAMCLGCRGGRCCV